MGLDHRRAFVAPWGRAVLAGLAMASVAGGQTLPEKGFEPVDQAVADVDPLAVSLRRRSAGLGDIGQDTVVFRRRLAGATAPRHDKLYLITPGIVAEFDRANYQRLGIAGRSVQVAAVPPNTVFHLGLPRTPLPASGRADAQRRVDRRIDGRWRPQAVELARPGTRSHRRAAGEAASAFQRRQQAAVMRAIDRIVAAEAGRAGTKAGGGSTGDR